MPNPDRRFSDRRLAPPVLALAVALSLSPWVVGVPSAHAQAVAEAMSISLPAQPLGTALNELARQARLQLMVHPDLVAGRQAPALSGEMTPRQALDRLLAGSGLAAEIHGAEVIVRTAPTATPGSGPNSSLAPVVVSADAQRGATTEGTGTYASKVVTLGKTIQSVREIPQSISVMTRQRIEDQGMVTIADVLQQATGVTMESSGYNGSASAFYSRGFKIGNVLVDGAVIDGFGTSYSPNLALYDSVQILRGADGLFGGTGTPGGTVNLVRKRPTAQRQLLVTGTGGRWNQYYGELDAAGPLTQDGRVRGRLLVSHRDREFFYDTGRSKDSLLYGIVEMDVTPQTVVSLGGHHERINDVPWRSGLPRYADGSDLRLPRHTALIPTWNDRKRRNQEFFAQIEQRLGGDWRMGAQFNYMTSESSIVAVDGTGAVDPSNNLVPSFGSSHKEWGSRRKAIDINASGSFHLLGRQHRLLIGADWQDVRNDEYNILTEFSPALQPINVFNFDPAMIPYPSVVRRGSGYPDYGSTQKALYARLNLGLTDRLKAVLGSRYSSYQYQSPSVSFDRSGAITSSSMYRYEQNGIFTPYAGLTYDLDKRWTTYANIAEIYQSQAANLQGPLPGTPLDAVRGRNYEIGVKGELAEGRITTSFALYRIERTGEGVRDPNYPSTPVGDVGLNCCFIAQGKIISQGVDTEIAGYLARGWQVMAGYTYNANSNRVANAVYHTRTPKHLFKLWSTYRLPEGLSSWLLGGGVTAQSATYVTGTANTFNPATGLFNGTAVPFQFDQPGYAVWNAFVQYRINRHWTTTLNINNLFDKTYYKQVGSSTSGNWYGDPRNLVLSVRGAF